MFGVIAFACHQMSAAHVDPFYRSEQMTELLFEGIKHLFEIMACRLAKRMKMKSLDSAWQRRQLFGRYPEAGAG